MDYFQIEVNDIVGCGKCQIPVMFVGSMIGMQKLLQFSVHRLLQILCRTSNLGRVSRDLPVVLAVPIGLGQSCMYRRVGNCQE